MAYDEFLADRVRMVLKEKNVTFYDKQMMGGLVFMVDDKMCVGIVRNELMVRIDPEKQDALLRMAGAREMDFTGKSMKGFLFIKPEGTDMDKDLEYWVQLALEFNPRARSSKSKKK